MADGVIGYLDSLSFFHGRNFFREFGNPTVVLVKPMPQKIRNIAWTRTKMKACYNNIADIMCFFPGSKYVIGYAAGVIPVAHAWIRIGDEYFDPTWEKFNEIGVEYVSIFELDWRGFLAAIERNGNRPPSPEEMVNLCLSAPADTATTS